MSNEQLKYLKKIKKDKLIISFFQIIIIVLFLITWELLAKFKIINTFLYSYPTEIFKTIFNLFIKNNLLSHILTTLNEVIISFILSSLLGIIIASILWYNEKIQKILDPYLTVLNSLPKVSLGPLIIIWMGAGFKSVILMGLLISVFTTIINIYHSFIETNSSDIMLMKSFNANKFQIYHMLIIPSNIKNIINVLKVNISLNFIGIIMGELLVSKKGIGYLIMYGTQVFNISLVITCIFILAILSYILYKIICFIEKKAVNFY